MSRKLGTRELCPVCHVVFPFVLPPNEVVKIRGRKFHIRCAAQVYGKDRVRRILEDRKEEGE